MADQGELFELDVEPLPRLSADARRTARQRAQVAAGVHPLTGGKARPDLGTCGGCVHRVLVGGHAKSYPKCDAFGRTTMTSSAATDVRKGWPACDRFEPRSVT